jgi:hypothetical protein
VLRIRWPDPEPEDRAASLPWSYAALITGTLFLNFPFWIEHGPDLWMPGSLPQDAGLLGAVALAITVLFFAGPALASHAARQPLFELVESSLGSIPAWLVRLSSAWFLVVWIGRLISLPAAWFLPFILRRDVSTAESGAIAAALVVLLFVTGLQSFRTSAKMALFSDKLGLAVLVAALVRVHAGLQDGLNQAFRLPPYIRGL